MSRNYKYNMSCYLYPSSIVIAQTSLVIYLEYVGAGFLDDKYEAGAYDSQDQDRQFHQNVNSLGTERPRTERLDEVLQYNGRHWVQARWQGTAQLSHFNLKISAKTHVSLTNRWISNDSFNSLIFFTIWYVFIDLAI